MDGQSSGSARGRGRGRSRGRGRGGGGIRKNKNKGGAGDSATHPTAAKRAPVTAAPPSEAAIATSLSSVAFATMDGLVPEVRTALVSDFGYTHASAIQELAIPIGLAGSDLIAQARTGTGKTIAFLTPTVQKEAVQSGGAKAIGVLVLAPTRELAQQIEREAKILGARLAVDTVVVMGGTNMKAEAKKLQNGAGILVATPGRLIDHIDNTPGFAGKLKRCHTVILDECDR